MMEKTIENLQRFADDHKIVLETKGECGFGRSAVGFLHGDNYVAHNPFRMGDAPDFEFIHPKGFEKDPRLCAPRGVDAYHKHDCLAVLVSDEDYDKALKELNMWVEHLESQGEVEVATYATGETGLQALVSGVFGYAIRFKEVHKEG